MILGGKSRKPLFLAMALLPLYGVEGRACPGISTCQADEQMTVEKDAQGCNVVTCLRAEANQVDEYYQDIPPKARANAVGETTPPVAPAENSPRADALSGPAGEEAPPPSAI